MKPGRIELHIGRLVVDGPVAAREGLHAALAQALQRELAARWSAEATPHQQPAAPAPRWTAPLAEAIAARWSPEASAATATPTAHGAGAHDV